MLDWALEMEVWISVMICILNFLLQGIRIRTPEDLRTLVHGVFPHPIYPHKHQIDSGTFALSRSYGIHSTFISLVQVGDPPPRD